jgi:hypothetical protein
VGSPSESTVAFTVFCIAHADAAHLGALMVAQSAADPAGAAFDAAGKPARYKNFHFTVHMDARV